MKFRLPNIYTLWLAALPVFPPLGLLSLGGLGRVRDLPRGWQGLLAVFLATQVGAALLTPEPLWSVPLAVARGLLTVALIVTGFALGAARGSDAFRPALVGYGVVALTAFATTLALTPGSPLTTRLVHPYFTTVSLGLAGTLGLLLAVTWRGGPLAWRLLAVGLGLGMFVWSGSRGPLIALGAGLLAALAVGARRQWRAVALTVVGGAAVFLALQAAVPGGVFGRFTDQTLSGRGTFWADALAAARAHPWGGTGPYQLGPSFTTQYGEESCRFWLQNSRYGFEECPPVIEAARGAWLIAHNTAFHLLGETGILGLSGWLALMGALAVAAWRSRDPLVNGVTWATAAMGLVDNPTLLPNLGHAELYWLLSGTGLSLALREQPAGKPAPSLSPAAPLLATLLLGYFTLPLWLERVRPGPTVQLPVLRAITLPTRLDAGQGTTVLFRVDVPKASYLLRGRACAIEPGSQEQTGCTTVLYSTLTGPQQTWLRAGLRVPRPGRYRLYLRFAEESPGLKVTPPLAELVRVIEVE